MKSTFKIIFLLVCTIFCLSSCVTNKQTDFLQDIKLEYPQVMVEPEEYKIIPGDQLSIVVYAWDPETARLFTAYAPQFTYRGLDESTGVSVGSQIRGVEGTWGVKPTNVYADGTINFPYIGKVYVQGLTMLQVKTIVSQKLNAFSEGTTADVTLANRYFSILGEAGANRITMTSTSMTIFQALAIATNIGAYGDRSKVTVIRQTAAGSVTKTFDLRSKEIVDTEFYYIQPNDVLYVPQSKSKFFGSTTSFAGVFGVLASLAGIVIIVLRIF